MRTRTTAVTAPVALVLTLTALSACASDDPDYSKGTGEVQAVSPTSVRAGAVEVVVPAGAATGGKLAVQEGPEPATVPQGVVALGPAAAVTLLDGSLDGSMTVSFEPPDELTPDLVPIVMAKDEQGEWQWLPTWWEAETERVAAELDRPTQVYLARFDPEPLLGDVVEELGKKTNNLAKVEAPSCGDEAAPLAAGLQVTSEPGGEVLWCAGVDTIDSNPAVSDYDLLADEGVQARVLRLTNNSRMYQELGYPDAWPAVDGSGLALPGDELRARLGLSGRTRDGLNSRILAPGETLTLHLPGPEAELSGTVTADRSAAAWTLSGLDFATSTYTRVVSDVDEALGDQVRDFREELMAALAASPASQPAADGSDGSQSAFDIEGLQLCLSSLAETIVVNPEVARQLVEQAAGCSASLLRPALATEEVVGPAQMADSVASAVLRELPEGLGKATEPWAAVPDTLTDEHAGFQVWLGPPPVQDYDYTDEPSVFRPGDDVDVDEWDPQFGAYVEERLQRLLENNDAEQADSAGIVVGTACPEGELSVHRYRTDGFALAGVVTCGGQSHTVVLARQSEEWQEIEGIQDGDEFFGCEVMGRNSVPAFIAGDTCLDGDEPQEYTG